MGRVDGLTREEIELRSPGELELRRSEHWTYPPPGGESYEMLAARVAFWLDEAPADSRRVVVAHGAMGRVLRGLYAGLPRDETLSLEEPQDAFFRLNGGGIERIAVAP